MRTRNPLHIHQLVVILAIAVAFVPALAAETSGYHKHLMKGSILSIQDHGVYLCIGTERGATAGQVLDVVKITRVRVGSPKAAPRYERRLIGKVRIDALVNGHFARATVVEGEAVQGSIVLLKG
jgi:hypothetical protein